MVQVVEYYINLHKILVIKLSCYRWVCSTRCQMLLTVRLCTIVLCVGHRRRINTEEKAKVVAAVWGTKFIKFLAALAVLH